MDEVIARAKIDCDSVDKIDEIENGLTNCNSPRGKATSLQQTAEIECRGPFL